MKTKLALFTFLFVVSVTAIMAATWWETYQTHPSPATGTEILIGQTAMSGGTEVTFMVSDVWDGLRTSNSTFTGANSFNQQVTASAGVDLGSGKSVSNGNSTLGGLSVDLIDYTNTGITGTGVAYFTAGGVLYGANYNPVNPSTQPTLSGDNVYTGLNTFTQPVTLASAVGTGQAVNLAQLNTALSTVGGGGGFGTPVGTTNPLVGGEWYHADTLGVSDTWTLPAGVDGDEIRIDVQNAAESTVLLPTPVYRVGTEAGSVGSVVLPAGNNAVSFRKSNNQWRMLDSGWEESVATSTPATRHMTLSIESPSTSTTSYSFGRVPAEFVVEKVYAVNRGIGTIQVNVMATKNRDEIGVILDLMASNNATGTEGSGIGTINYPKQLDSLASFNPGDDVYIVGSTNNNLGGEDVEVTDIFVEGYVAE